MKYLRIAVLSSVPIISCDNPAPRPQPPPPVAAPAAPEGPPLPPVAPGQYVNHIGNPAAGSWGPDGQWQWKDPQSSEASDTWKYLAAAGAGAAGGAALSYMLSRRHFEKKHPSGTWTRAANVHDEHTYRDRRGNPISREEYERRRAQSERDRAAHRARVQSSQQQYRDKKGKFISKEEWQRRQTQSTRDKARHRSSPARTSSSRSRRRR